MFDIVTLGINSRDQKKILNMPAGIDYYISYSGDVYVLEKEYERLVLYFLDLYRVNDLGHVREMLKLWKTFYENAVLYCSSEDIDLKQLHKILLDLSTFLYVPIVAGEAYEQFLAYYGMSQEELHALCSPIRKNYESQEWRDFLKLAQDPSELALGKHVHLYGWTNAKYFERMPSTEEDLKKRLHSYGEDPIEELKQLEFEERATDRIIQEAIKKYTISEDVIRMGREMVWLRNERADATTRIGVLLRPYWSQIATQHGLKYEDLLYLTFDEIMILSEKGICPDFEVRKRHYCYENISGTSSVSQKKKLEEGFSDITFFEGRVAYSGKVRGVAKTILRDEDISKIQEGDILVATMTLPSYILGMQKAVAIITDDGGITCHAAIVARELKKPCIIGTKIATRVLKDGDLVEVDAERGVVRILNP